MRFAGEQLGGGFSALMGQSTNDFGAMGKNQMEYRSKEKIAGHQAESQVNQYGLKSIADIKAAEAQAEATRAEGQAAGQAAMFDGLMNGISGIASAGIQKWGAPNSIANMNTSTPTWRTAEGGFIDFFKAQG